MCYDMNKVFCIGLSKTATMSITYYMRKLGFKSKHWIGDSNISNIIEEVKKYDFLSDIPIPIYFKKLDKEFPNSKFILTVREINSWLRSCKKHFSNRKGGASKDFRLKLYGINGYDKKKFIKVYKDHHKNVKEYFKERNNDLLILDIIGGDSPDKITEFLDIDSNNKKFPHSNKSNYKWKKKYFNNILMTAKEIRKIRNYLHKDDVVLEWGSGGSTLYFPLFVKEYHSIEHSKKWFNKINPKIPYNANIHFVKANKKTYRCYKRKNYKDYIEYVHKLGIPKFDKVLIDGRGRKFCAKEVLPYLKENSIVFIHDWHWRERYHSILEFYKKIDEIKSINNKKGLVVLKKRSV